MMMKLRRRHTKLLFFPKNGLGLLNEHVVPCFSGYVLANRANLSNKQQLGLGESSLHCVEKVTDVKSFLSPRATVVVFRTSIKS